MEGSIRVIFSEGSNKQSGNNRTVINTRTGKAKSQNEVAKENEKASSISNFVNSSVVMSSAKRLGSILLDEALYEQRKYYDLTDNVEGKRDLNIAVGLIHRGASIASATIIGAKTAGVAGAVVGFSIGAIREGISIYQGYDQQNIQLRQLQTQLAYTRERAGYSLTSGSIGENK